MLSLSRRENPSGVGQGIGPLDGRRTPSSEAVTHGVKANEQCLFTGATGNRDFHR